MRTALLPRIVNLSMGFAMATAAAAHDGHGQDEILHLHGSDVVRDALVLALIVLVAALAWRRK